METPQISKFNNQNIHNDQLRRQQKMGKFCDKISPVINALAEKREINVVKSNVCVEFRILMKHSNEDSEYVNHSELGNEIHSTITNQQLKDLGVIQLNSSLFLCYSNLDSLF